MAELNDSPPGLTFPCEFPIKAMGRSDAALPSIVVEIVQRHAPALTAESVTTSESSGGRYVSVTATITADSREQLDAIYADLKAHESVLATL
ncbi:DUF493 domain-containing protein [Spiribacter sp. 1M153]|uniref:HP0495 family protein n=1 Tax=Spiribacter roseus TaxID=1855875 RepID=UPI00349F356F